MSYDIKELSRAYDQACLNIFTGSDSAFFAPLLCTLDLKWDDTMPTAYVTSKEIGINPSFFMGLPVSSRSTLLSHELHHIGRLHLIRRGTRDPRIWNWACDISINNDLLKDGASFQGLEFGLFDSDYEDYAEEAIYDALVQKVDDGVCSIPTTYEHSDIGEELDPIEASILVDKVVHAAQVSTSMGRGVPGNIEVFLDELLNPVLPWEKLLEQFISERQTKRQNWTKRNRRYRSVVVPTKQYVKDGLSNPTIYLDVSGSISENQLNRIVSESFNLMQKYNPTTMRMVQFTTEITKETTINSLSDLQGYSVVGRGMTHLECVREHILKNQPPYVIVFTDLHCEPMNPLDTDTPVIWVVLGNPHATTEFGQVIHVKEDYDN